MAGPANLIKAQIKSNLDALVTAGTLGAVVEKDLNVNPLSDDLPGYPCAVLGTSDMQSDWLYQQYNRRTYTFDILIAQLVDNLAAMGDLEDLRDAIALQFDNDVTLNGAAPLGVSAIMSPKMQIASAGKNWAVFYVRIKATTLAALTYNF